MKRDKGVTFIPGLSLFPYILIYETVEPWIGFSLLSSWIRLRILIVVSDTIFLSHFVLFHSIGVCFRRLKLSVDDVIICRKGSNGEWKFKLYGISSIFVDDLDDKYLTNYFYEAPRRDSNLGPKAFSLLEFLR